jgi:glutathione S-transferase
MIAESSIIIEYLDYHFSTGTRLIPSDPDGARQTRFHDRNADLYLNESITMLHKERLKPQPQRNADAITQAQFRINVMYDYLDDHLRDKRWMMIDNFTMADCAMAPPLSYAQYVAPFDGRTNIASYWQRLKTRTSFKTVLREAGPYLEQFKAAAGYR